MNKKLILFSFILFFLKSNVSHLVAQEHWRTYDSSNIPWERASSLVSFQNSLLVAGTPKSSTNANIFLWRSSDGSTWQDITLPPPFNSPPQIISHFKEHGGVLYAFAVESSTFLARVYRSADGINWSSGDSGQFVGSISFDDVISYQGYLYTFDSSGRIWRSDGVGSPPNWTVAASAPFPENGDVTHSFVQKSNRLFAGYGVSGPFSSTIIYEYVGTANLTHRGGTELGEILRNSFVEHENEVYWAGTSLKKFNIIGNTVSFDSLQAGIFPTPFVLNNQLHVIGITGQVLVYSSTTWSTATEALTPTCVTDRPKFGYPAVIGETTYLLPCDLVSVTNGVDDIESLNFNFSNITLDSRSQKGLELSFDVNFNETITEMTVVNTGSAVSQNDISQLTLIRSANDTVLTTLSPQLDGKTWIFPSNFDLDLSDGDRLEIRFDVASTAQIGATVRFQIPATNGMQFSVNSNFTMSQLNGPGPVIISDVSTVTDTILAAPNPSRDTAIFFYTLASQSDVFIKIFDRSGREIAELTERSKPSSNRSSTSWDVRSVAPGVYLAHIRIKDEYGERTHKTHIAIER